MNDKLNDHVDELQPESMDDHLRGFDDRDDEPQDVAGPIELDDRSENYEIDEMERELEQQQEEDFKIGMSRRGLLSGVGAAAGALAVGATSPLWTPAEPAEAHGSLSRYCYVDGARTYYEGNGAATCFYYRPSFHTRCNYVVDLWDNNTPSGYGRPWRMWSYGVHTDHRTSTAHNNGRGFDFTRMYVTINGSLARRFYARYDRWSGTSSAATERRRYWGTAAACHYRLRNVLTYYYNSAHHNHIHMDNLVSGTGNSTFSTGSTTQVQSAQAMCRWIWGKSTAIDGVWGPQTRQHTHEVLVRIGKGGYLTSGQSYWLAFNRATTRKAYGVQSY
ncbi:MAG: twin-arginine translocation signal domain-containing protein [Micromonosporaceae bacterium]